MGTLPFRYTGYSKYKEFLTVDKKAWIIFGVIVVALFGGLIFVAQKNKIDVSNVDANAILAASDKNGNIADHVFGKEKSKVVLIEYGDFQCPYCGQDHPGIKSVTEKYKDQITFVFRNFPLTNMHPNARAAAGAAEAAGLMGKYWEMNNILYEHQDEWSNLNGTERTTQFVKYAKEIGLDEAKFKDNLEKSSLNQKISFDQALGKKIGVTATPTLYLNGTKLSDDVPSDQSKLDAAIQAELKKQGIALPSDEATDKKDK